MQENDYGISFACLGKADPHKWSGEAIRWRVDPPVKFTKIDDGKTSLCETPYVITSCVYALFSGIETYAFPTDEDGNVLSWSELPGSKRGTDDHEAVMMRLDHGVYDVKEDDDE